MTASSDWSINLVAITLDSAGNFDVKICPWLIGVTVIVIVFMMMKNKFNPSSYYEIDEAEIGVGTGKIKIKPDYKDLQIAYQLWVELRTRKLGLPIEEGKDVIHEVYNSWHEYFKITRELIKTIPAQKIKHYSHTRDIVSLSIRILNDVVRPHLTEWQARYRRWYDYVSVLDENKYRTPQEIQESYPYYSDLIVDMKRVNSALVLYGENLKKMVDDNL